MQAHKDDLKLLTDAARASGEIAQGFFKSDPQVWDKEDDAGPVTEADLAIDTMLKQTLQAARPTYGWLSEETEDDAERLSRDSVFIVDPIDGTRAFIAGQAHWAHSLAITHKGVPTVAAVYLPIMDMMFTATLGGGAFLNGAPTQVADRAHAEGACVLAAKPNFEAKYWPGGFPGIRRSFRSSLAYRLCLVAEGAFDGMLTLRGTWEWDVAAGALIVAEAGGIVTTQTGDTAVFNNAHPKLNGMVASNPAIHRQLIKGLTPPDA
ncbi:MAG: inositol monophosphatase family protein [Planktomarina sp.]